MANSMDFFMTGDANMLNVALVQMTSGPDIEQNCAALENAIREAAAKGATFILTPENSCHMCSPPTKKLQSSPVESGHPILARCAALAAGLGVNIALGSLSIRVDQDRVANRSYLLDAKGNIVAKYDKIHLFDVILPTGETHRESQTVMPGDRAVVADMDFGKIGMSICYDVRFAYLYRALAQRGAEIMLVPAAFTVPTGQAHWQTLLRARAIETGSFVLAAAQTGTHEGGRNTYGHSMVISPWGEVIAELGDQPGILYAQIDLSAPARARAAIPALQHDRTFTLEG